MNRRKGFTLLELLVVLGIASVLAGIAWFAYVGAVGDAREKGTKADLLKIDRLLNDRANVFAYVVSKNTRALNPVIENRAAVLMPTISADLTSAGLSVNDQYLRRIAVEHATKERFAAVFPQRWDECPAGAAPSIINVETESAEVLYYFLFVAECGGIGPTGLGDVEVSVRSRDTDANGRLEVVDHWDRPIQFYRWPTRLIRPNGAGDTPTRAYIDAMGMMGTDLVLDEDPLDVTQARLWAAWRTVRDTATPGETEDSWYTPGCWHAPLAVSAGRDGVLGMELPNKGRPFGSPNNRNGLGLVTDPAALTDNLTSWGARK